MRRGYSYAAGYRCTIRLLRPLPPVDCKGIGGDVRCNWGRRHHSTIAVQWFPKRRRYALGSFHRPGEQPTAYSFRIKALGDGEKTLELGVVRMPGNDRQTGTPLRACVNLVNNTRCSGNEIGIKLSLQSLLNNFQCKRPNAHLQSQSQVPVISGSNCNEACVTCSFLKQHVPK